MKLALGLSRRCFQFRSALSHGGFNRIFDVMSERAKFGYSTRSLSYSWPKKIYLHSRISKEKSCHFFIPHLLEAGAFGGIATLAKILLDLAAQYDRSFVYLSDFSGSLESLRKISGASDALWEKLKNKIQILDFSQVDFINVEANIGEDHFVASAWWTKLSLEPLLSKISEAQLTYIIQDDEALFYDASDPVEKELQELAQSSYKGRYHAIVNSKFLADYLIEKQIVKNPLSLQVFEPQINYELFKENLSVQKEKILLVYARPEVRRNRFDLCVELLKEATSQGLLVNWTVYGIGSLKKNVYLGPGKELVALGKLDLNHYAALCQHSRVGICLMECPHPSYPPLEMAHAGMKVVCNRFANRDYSVLGPNYYCGNLNSNDLLLQLKAALRDSLL